jgi:hypothetical protein
MCQKDDFVHRVYASHLFDFIKTPYDSRLPQLLAEISTEKAKAGRGMMTASVVRQNGDQRPGRGFFELAERLGYGVSDPKKFWLEQVTKYSSAGKRRMLGVNLNILYNLRFGFETDGSRVMACPRIFAPAVLSGNSDGQLRRTSFISNRGF